MGHFRNFRSLLILVIFVVIFVTACGSDSSRTPPIPTAPTPAPSTPTTPTPTAPKDVEWHLTEGGDWVATGQPPPCPDPLVLATPVDISLVTSVLYPGQPRGNAFKPHGGFRFDNQPNNDVAVTVPLDATIRRGSRAFRSGENQYAFEFIAPCGIFYTYGHILDLSPKYLAIANTLPLVGDFATQQFFDVVPPVAAIKGETIATRVGFASNHNVFVELAVLDLRHKNGFSIRPEWAAFSSGFDQYAICWLDWLTPVDTARLRALPGADSVYGKLSDYCR